MSSLRWQMAGPTSVCHPQILGKQKKAGVRETFVRSYRCVFGKMDTRKDGQRLIDSFRVAWRSTSVVKSRVATAGLSVPFALGVEKQVQISAVSALHWWGPNRMKQSRQGTIYGNEHPDKKDKKNLHVIRAENQNSAQPGLFNGGAS